MWTEADDPSLQADICSSLIAQCGTYLGSLLCAIIFCQSLPWCLSWKDMLEAWTKQCRFVRNDWLIHCFPTLEWLLLMASLPKYAIHYTWKKQELMCLASILKRNVFILHKKLMHCESEYLIGRGYCHSAGWLPLSTRVLIVPLIFNVPIPLSCSMSCFVSCWTCILFCRSAIKLQWQWGHPIGTIMKWVLNWDTH